MATYLHFAPAVALAAAFGTRHVGCRLMAAGAVCAVMPDLDFLLVTMQVDRFSGTYGHRGFTHSLGFALIIGLLGFAWPDRDRPGAARRAFRGSYLALCTASHPLMDSLIDMHICCAWWWPLDGLRHCFDWRPIPMRGVSIHGWERLRVELQWIGLPLFMLANGGMLLRRAWAWWLARQPGPPPVPPAPASGPEGPGPRARRRQRVAFMQSVGRAWQNRSPGFRSGGWPTA